MNVMMKSFWNQETCWKVSTIVGMKSDVHKKCEGCITCASVQGQGHRERSPLKSITVGGPFGCVGIDF